MPIKRRTGVSPEFNMSSLTDIVFLLLIFFMLTSSFVTPNALKLLLPKADSPTLAKQTVSVSISKELEYFVEGQKVSKDNISDAVFKHLTNDPGESIVVSADQSVALEHVVYVMNVGKKLNKKVILATRSE